MARAIHRKVEARVSKRWSRSAKGVGYAPETSPSARASLWALPFRRDNGSQCSAVHFKIRFAGWESTRRRPSFAWPKEGLRRATHPYLQGKPAVAEDLFVHRGTATSPSVQRIMADRASWTSLKTQVSSREMGWVKLRMPPEPKNCFDKLGALQSHLGGFLQLHETYGLVR